MRNEIILYTGKTDSSIQRVEVSRRHILAGIKDSLIANYNERNTIEKDPQSRHNNLA